LTQVAKDDVKVVLIGNGEQAYTAQRWLGYTAKEADKARWDVVDWHNAQNL
jgi:hypothetical protein